MFGSVKCSHMLRVGASIERIESKIIDDATKITSKAGELAVCHLMRCHRYLCANAAFFARGSLKPWNKHIIYLTLPS